MTAGRPSKYEDRFCDMIVEKMGAGFSLTAAAGDIGVSRETVYDWERNIPEFSDAVKRARAKRTLKLEGDLLGAESGPVVTSRIFALKNACPAEWREKVDHELTGKDGGPIETVDTTMAEAARRIAYSLRKAAEAAESAE